VSAVVDAQHAAGRAAEGAAARHRIGTAPTKRVTAVFHGSIHGGAQADAALPRCSCCVRCFRRLAEILQQMLSAVVL
jgi:bacterioferritin-associated ferredoxin